MQEHGQQLVRPLRRRCALQQPLAAVVPQRPARWSLAALLGLSLDPHFPPQAPVGRAIEVYPHPATVTLFHLDRILPYKVKQGRSPQDRRTALQSLMSHLASLPSATPPLIVAGCDEWAVAERGVATAQTHADLNRWEDAVDAVVCAYVGCTGGGTATPRALSSATSRPATSSCPSTTGRGAQRRPHLRGCRTLSLRRWPSSWS